MIVWVVPVVIALFGLFTGIGIGVVYPQSGHTALAGLATHWNRSTCAPSVAHLCDPRAHDVSLSYCSALLTNVGLRDDQQTEQLLQALFYAGLVTLCASFGVAYWLDADLTCVDGAFCVRRPPARARFAVVVAVSCWSNVLFANAYVPQMAMLTIFRTAVSDAIIAAFFLMPGIGITLSLFAKVQSMRSAYASGNGIVEGWLVIAGYYVCVLFSVAIVYQVGLYNDTLTYSSRVSKDLARWGYVVLAVVWIATLALFMWMTCPRRTRFYTTTCAVILAVSAELFGVVVHAVTPRDAYDAQPNGTRIPVLPHCDVPAPCIDVVGLLCSDDPLRREVDDQIRLVVEYEGNRTWKWTSDVLIFGGGALCVMLLLALRRFGRELRNVGGKTPELAWVAPPRPWEFAFTSAVSVYAVLLYASGIVPQIVLLHQYRSVAANAVLSTYISLGLLGIIFSVIGYISAVQTAFATNVGIFESYLAVSLLVPPFVMHAITICQIGAYGTTQTSSMASSKRLGTWTWYALSLPFAVAIVLFCTVPLIAPRIAKPSITLVVTR